MVSVIIPNYNNRETICQAIDSALNQTYKNIEVLVIDDSSTDGSYAFIESRYGNRIRLIQNQRLKGACGARNTGLINCSGEFVQFLDSDDFLSEDKIRSQLHLIGHDKNLVASCSWVHFTDDILDCKPHMQFIDKSYSKPVDWLIDSWNGRGMGQTGIWLVSRAIAIKAGMWDEDLKRNQDGEFLCRILLCSKKIYFASNVLVYYRIPNRNNVSQNNSRESVDSHYKSLIKCELNISGLSNKSLTNALAKSYGKFILTYYDVYQDIAESAATRMARLSGEVVLPSESAVFLTIQRVFGWKMALKLRRIVKI